MSAKMDEQALLALLRELAIDSQRVEHPAIASGRRSLSALSRSPQP